MRFFFALLLIIPLLSACDTAKSLSNRIEPPDVSLINIVPSDMTVFEQRYTVTLRVQNPNDAALPITGMKFDLELNGEKFARGVSSEHVRVPALGEATLYVSVSTTTFNWLEQLKILNSWKPGEAGMSYDLSGLFYLDGIMKNVAFSRKGNVPVPLNADQQGAQLQ